MAHAIKVIYSIRDNKGKLATTEVKAPTGKTIAQYQEFAQKLGTLINNVVIGQIVNVSIAFTVDISTQGWAASPGLTSDVEEKGVFQYLTVGGFNTGVALPTWSDLLVANGSDAVDLTDPDVIAFNAAMLTGVTLVDTSVISPCDAREDDIASLVFARERFRASGKRA